MNNVCDISFLLPVYKCCTLYKRLHQFNTGTEVGKI